jgi:hypothetical protein
MEPQTYHTHSKLINKVEDIMSDMRKKHYSDAVIHSQQLIDYLVSKAVKELKPANEFWKYTKTASLEERLGLLLDNFWITERIFDNCVITKGIRNPTEHHFTYPYEHFALGSVTAAIELYYDLQVLLPLPSIDRLDEFAEEYKIHNSVTLLVKSKRAITAQEYQSLEVILQSLPGSYPVLVDFPEGASESPGIHAKKKTAFSYELLPQIKTLEFVENAGWITVPTTPDYPHRELYFDLIYKRQTKT